MGPPTDLTAAKVEVEGERSPPEMAVHDEITEEDLRRDIRTWLEARFS